MHDLLHIEGCQWVLTSPTGLPSYDFDFSPFFDCHLVRAPSQRPDRVRAVARIGAAQDYREFHEGCASVGIDLLHSPSVQQLASELPSWYPHIEDLTPASVWFDTVPSASEALLRMGLPLFLKGSRQTWLHDASRSIIRSREQLERVLSGWSRDPRLSWQRVVCRRYVPLRFVEPGVAGRIPVSFEFRTFWWRPGGTGAPISVGFGPYWWQASPYRPTDQERSEALSLAQEAAGRVAVPFLVVDVAMTAEGQWIVIEFNDGQESGYNGVHRVEMWHRIIKAESYV